MSSILDDGPHHTLLVHETAAGPVFVVQLRGVPAADDVRRAMAAMESSPSMRMPYAMLWVLTPDIRGFDRSLLEVHRDARRRAVPRFVGVVAWHRMQRAVVRAMRPGVRLSMGIELEVFATEADAMKEASRRLAAHSSPPP